MSTATQNTYSASLAPANADLSADHAKPHAAGKESAFDRGDHTKNISDTLEQILDVLQGSTIAEELGKDVESKFWATYKKVSNEYDDDFLERANDDMAIILTFAGLFSAVNSTFIIGMQPNPGDTTNVLILELIKVIANGTNAVNDISNLSSSTNYPSSIVWVHTLSYASLAFSLLAALGAVMGKQWLNSYKAARGRGSLEERGLQRQMKLDGLERWHLQTVLGAFFVLLQFSLLLFGLSLSAYMFGQQRTISGIIICSTALGILFYVVTIIISVLYPDSPFQTAGSALVRAISKRILLVRSTLNPDMKPGRISAIRWILDVSTNPEAVEAAAGMVPHVEWPLEFVVSAMYARLYDIFVTCVPGSEAFVACGKALTHFRVHSPRINPVDWREETIWRSCADRSHFIRDAFMDARLAYNQLEHTEDDSDRRRHMADARTALRTMVVHGLTDNLSNPDDDDLIWNGDFLWCHSNGHTPSYEDFDWLINYLVDTLGDRGDYDTAGDALLALSAMRGLGSSARRYVDTLIRCLDPNRPPRLQHAALRAVSDARKELASIPQGGDDAILDTLSRAILDVAQRFRYDDDSQNRCYLRLISALAKNVDWHKRLICDRHLQWCNYLLGNVLESTFDHNKAYLTMIFLRVDSSGKDTLLNPATPQKCWRLIKRAWNTWGSYLSDDLDSADIIDALPALVIATKEILADPNNDSLRAGLSRDVYRVLKWLEERPATICQADGLVNTALPVVQGLYGELSS